MERDFEQKKAKTDNEAHEWLAVEVYQEGSWFDPMI